MQDPSPTEASIRRLLADLEVTWSKRNRTEIQTVLVAAARRDERGGPNVADGYATSRALDDGGRGGSELTPVESAANARLNRRPPPDPLHQHLELVLDMLTQAAFSLRAVRNTCDKILMLTDDHTYQPDCELHARIHVARPADRTARDLAGLNRIAELCEPCYQFVSKHHTEPEEWQLRSYENGHGWRGRIDPTEMPSAS